MASICTRGKLDYPRLHINKIVASKRNCAVSNMRRAGLDPFTIMKFTGRRALKMIERYNPGEKVDGKMAYPMFSMSCP